METQTVDQTTPSTEEAQPQAQPELTITDLQNIRSLIETMVRRGVFQAQEYSAVGAIYDKLNNFLNLISSQNNQG